MRPDLALLLILGISAIVGCSPGSHQVTSSNGADQTEPDKICFHNHSRNPKTLLLTSDQSSKLHRILDGSLTTDPFSRAEPGVMIEPSQDLSFILLRGIAYQFIPPAQPHNFALSKTKIRQLQSFMEEAYQIRSRWDTPKQEQGDSGHRNQGEQDGGGNAHEPLSHPSSAPPKARATP